MHLTLDDHGIDDVAEIIAGGKPVDAHRAGRGIHLDLAHVRAGREGEVGRVVERVLIEAGLEPVERIVVRHVSGERDLGEGLLAIRAGDAELAVRKLHVGIARLEQVRGDLLALGDDLVGRLDDGGAAHGERARAVGAHAEEDLTGVAVLDVDVLHRDTELVRDDLGEGGFVSLPVAVRAGEHRDLACRVHAHLTGFEQARPGAERTGDVRRGDAAGLDVAGVSDTAQQSLLRARRLARREAVDISDLQHALQGCIIVAGVVGEAHGRGVGKLANEVASPQLRGIDPQLARRPLDDALEEVGRLGPPGSAISIYRGGVREDRLHLAIDVRRRVLTGKQRRVQDRRDAGSERRQVSAHVGCRIDAQREKLPVLVERQLGRGDVIASVRVRQKRLAALGGPLDRPADALARPHERGLLRIQIDLGAEAAADVRCHDAHLVLGKTQDERRHQQPLDVRVLTRHVQRV